MQKRGNLLQKKGGFLPFESGIASPRARQAFDFLKMSCNRLTPDCICLKSELFPLDNTGKKTGAATTNCWPSLELFKADGTEESGNAFIPRRVIFLESPRFVIEVIASEVLTTQRLRVQEWELC